MAKAKKTITISFMVTVAEKELLDKAAEVSDKFTSGFVRDAALASARKIVKKS